MNCFDDRKLRHFSLVFNVTTTTTTTITTVCASDHYYHHHHHHQQYQQINKQMNEWCLNHLSIAGSKVPVLAKLYELHLFCFVLLKKKKEEEEKEVFFLTFISCCFAFVLSLIPDVILCG